MTQHWPETSDDTPPDTLFGRAREAGVQPVGAALIALGAVLVLAAFTIFDWFREGPGFFGGAGAHSTFSDIGQLLSATQRQAAQQHVEKYVSFGASKPYFTWLGWTLLAASVALGALAVSRIGARLWSVKWLAAVVGAAGVGLTFLALNLITFEKNAPNNANAPTYSQFLGHSSLGAWAAIAGFALICAGSLVPHPR